ncbi:MAG: hypothetical protein V7676_03365 [Parasphingorhabdus sp.]|uniref:hypothetical protein n=1 Tax=Parasphingorhabdus sp. TaxID=2709688 RepID=UPI00300196F9
MDQNPGDGLVQKAAAVGVASAYVSDDLAAALFPKSGINLSDRMLSNGLQYLRAIIREIEIEICMIAAEEFGLKHDIIIEIGNSGRGHSYALLQSAGLLESKNLLEYVFTCIQRVELGTRLLQKISQADLESVLIRHLDCEDAVIADAAMALLVAQSRDNGGSGLIHAHISNLPADILFALTWPITAALQKLSGYEGQELIKAAEKLLGGHDEGAAIQSRARRLAQLVDHIAGSAESPHPLHDGVDLFLARLAQRSGLSVDQLILFTAEPKMMRLVLAMRAMDISTDHALSIFGALDGSGQMLTPASYNEIDVDRASELVSQWSGNGLLQDAQRKLNTHFSGLSV